MNHFEKSKENATYYILERNESDYLKEDSLNGTIGRHEILICDW